MTAMSSFDNLEQVSANNGWRRRFPETYATRTVAEAGFMAEGSDSEDLAFCQELVMS